MYSISEAPGGFTDDDEHNGFYRVSRIDCLESEQVKIPNSASRQGSRFCLHRVGQRGQRACVPGTVYTQRILRNPTKT